jgi:hypothetical protein
MTPATDPQGGGQTDGPTKRPALEAPVPFYWRLLVSQLFNVASGDHGSLLSVR